MVRDPGRHLMISLIPGMEVVPRLEPAAYGDVERLDGDSQRVVQERR
jgi:hypothetical protein